MEFFLPVFRDDICLCLVQTLKVYEQQTEKFRKGQGKAMSRLFLSLVGKHSPVCSSTIARWLKSFLQKAGVDTSVFKARSTRAASTTKAAMVGMSVEEIIQGADWSGKGVFRKFYYHLKHSLAYGSKVLATRASKSHVDIETEPSKI